jgi:hypothetical protein
MCTGRWLSSSASPLLLSPALWPVLVRPLCLSCTGPAGSRAKAVCLARRAVCGDGCSNAAWQRSSPAPVKEKVPAVAQRQRFTFFTGCCPAPAGRCSDFPARVSKPQWKGQTLAGSTRSQPRRAAGGAFSRLRAGAGCGRTLPLFGGTKRGAWIKGAKDVR